MRIFLVLFIILLGVSANYQTLAQTPANSDWARMSGVAVDISINMDGQAYVLSPGGTPWRWDKIEQRWRRMSGSFQRISAAEDNRPWAINSDGVVYRYNGLWWEDRDTDVVDVGADTKGNVYITNANGQIKKWYPLRSEWRPLQGPVDGKARRIAVDSVGQPWVILDNGGIRSFDGKNWISWPGQARDIAFGGMDMVAIADISGQIRTWSDEQKRWVIVAGVKEVFSLGLTPEGKFWVIVKGGKILSNGTLTSEESDTEEETLNQPKVTVPQAPSAVVSVEVPSVPTPLAVIATTPTATPITTQDTPTSETPNNNPTASDSLDPVTITTKDKITFINTFKSANNLAIGADGSVFALNNAGNVLRWSNTKKKFDNFPGTLRRIAVDKDGHPWGISALGRVFRHTGRQWKQIPNATASDISIGYDGTVLTANAAGRLYKLNDAGTFFKMIPGTGVSLVAAGPDGTPWAVRTDKLVQRCDVTPCKTYPQKANAIAVGPDGSVYIISNKLQLMRLDKNGKFKTIQIPGHTPSKVAVGPNGYPWVVSSANIALASIYFDRDEAADQREAAATTASGTTGSGATTTVVSTSASSFIFSKNMTFETVSYENLSPGVYSRLASAPDGTIWAGTGIGGLEKYDSARKKFVDADTKFASDSHDIADFDIAPNGDIWAYTLNPQVGLFRERNKQLKEYTVSGLTSGDVAVSPDGTVYAIFYTGGTYYLYKKLVNSENFTRVIQKDILDISVGPGNDIWIVDRSNYVQQWTGTKFEKRPASGQKASGIAVGKTDGTVYIRDTTNALRKWNGTNNSFDKVNNITVYYLAVDNEGRPWVNTDNTPTIKRGRD